MVEVQPDFCVRAAAMLERAQHTWPPLPGPPAAFSGSRGGGGGEASGAGSGPSLPRFEVACCGIREFLAGCPDGAYDVVLAAGKRCQTKTQTSRLVFFSRASSILNCRFSPYPSLVLSFFLFVAPVEKTCFSYRPHG
jgi:hypothetical protein